MRLDACWRQCAQNATPVVVTENVEDYRKAVPFYVSAAEWGGAGGQG